MASYIQNRVNSLERFFKSPQNHINHSFWSYLQITKFKVHKQAHGKYISEIWVRNMGCSNVENTLLCMMVL